MSNIFIPKNIEKLPFLDTDLIYVNPTYFLNPENYVVISKSLSTEILNKIRFGFYVGTTCSYPRFDLESYFYRIKQNSMYSFFPDRKPKYIDFETITNARATTIMKDATEFENTYLFWSGGIDSTTVLCAILKNWDAASLSHVIVVLNEHSIKEHPIGYQMLIHGKLKEIDTGEFFPGGIKLSNNSLYITGDMGDSIMGYDHVYEFDKFYPGMYKRSWKKR